MEGVRIPQGEKKNALDGTLQDKCSTPLVIVSIKQCVNNKRLIVEYMYAVTYSIDGKKILGKQNI